MNQSYSFNSHCTYSLYPQTCALNIIFYLIVVHVFYVIWVLNNWTHRRKILIKIYCWINWQFFTYQIQWNEIISGISAIIILTIYEKSMVWSKTENFFRINERNANNFSFSHQGKSAFVREKNCSKWYGYIFVVDFFGFRFLYFERFGIPVTHICQPINGLQRKMS